MGFSRNCKVKRKDYRKSLSRVYKRCKNVRIGLKYMFLEMKANGIIIKKRRNRNRLILSVMMNFMIERWKIRETRKKAKKNRKLRVKTIMLKSMNKFLEYKIYGS